MRRVQLRSAGILPAIASRFAGKRTFGLFLWGAGAGSQSGETPARQPPGRRRYDSAVTVKLAAVDTPLTVALIVMVPAYYFQPKLLEPVRL